MSKRKEPKITTGLYRYVIGIFDYYFSRGMNKDAAKVKSLDESYKVIRAVIEQDKDVPDYLVTVTAENTVHVLNKRGQQISKLIEQSKDEEEIERLRKALRDLKALIDETNLFIEQYKGAVVNG